MKIVVMGGSGLIGRRLVLRLKAAGHEAVAASPSTGVNALTGEGLAEVLEEAQVVVDVSGPPSFEEKVVWEFFEGSAKNLHPAEIRAGVKHHLALSVVGADVMTDSPYMRGKMVQERAIEASGVPYTIVRATQFFEFLGQIADGYTRDGRVRLSTALMQPIAAEDVSTELAQLALKSPANKVLELAGPESGGIDELARRLLKARGDTREVVGSPSGDYFGAKVTDATLRPKGDAMLGTTTFEEWLGKTL